MRDISSVIFAGTEKKSLDRRGRMVIAAPFMKILKAMNKDHAYVTERKIRLQEASYPILQIKHELVLPDKLTEEERMREYSAIRMKFDKLSRIILPEWFISHLSNGRDTPEEVIQAGGGDRIYVWHPEYFAEWKEKYLKTDDAENL